MTSPTVEFDLRPFQKNDLKRLADATGSPCISILLPTHRKGRETQQDPIRLKNLLSEASKKLEQQGYNDNLLCQLETLPGDSEFWRHQGNGLAVYVSKNQFELLRLNCVVKEHIHVGKSFLLSPLVREHNSQGECFVLTLSWDEAALHRYDGQSLAAVETERLPAKFDDLVLPRDPEESLQNTSHQSAGDTGGTSTAMFHGQGEGEDKIKADRRQYLSRVGDEVGGAIYNTGLPVMLIATKEVAGHFHAISQTSPDLTVEGSPSQLTEAQLLTQIQNMFGKVVNNDDRHFKERFGTALTNGKASNEIADIATAAKHGQIASLGFCEGSESIELNEIVTETLRHAGDVFRCEPEFMPDGKSLAAIFRY